jgi:hypothetical protein
MRCEPHASHGRGGVRALRPLVFPDPRGVLRLARAKGWSSPLIARSPGCWRGVVHPMYTRTNELLAGSLSGGSVRCSARGPYKMTDEQAMQVCRAASSVQLHVWCTARPANGVRSRQGLQNSAQRAALERDVTRRTACGAFNPPHFLGQPGWFDGLRGTRVGFRPDSPKCRLRHNGRVARSASGAGENGTTVLTVVPAARHGGSWTD